MRALTSRRPQVQVLYRPLFKPDVRVRQSMTIGLFSCQKRDLAGFRSERIINYEESYVAKL